MATILPIAYNTGSTISGTEQIGDLAIGTTSQDYSSNIGGVKWWASPDLDLQYVIGYVDLSGTHPNPISFVPCHIGFWGAGDKTENSFINLCNFHFNEGFTNGNDAKTWLNNNGYWTNFDFGTTPLPTSTPTLTPVPTDTPTPTPTSTPTPTPSSTPTETPIGPTDTPTPTPTPTETTTNQFFQLQTCPYDGNFYYSKDYPNGTFTDLNYPRVTGLLNSVPTTFIIDATLNNSLNPTGIEITSTGFFGCPTGDSLLMENGDNLLQENGDNLLLDILGYSFNLVASPYNFPSSGNSIMNDPIGNVSGSTEINLLATTGRGFYFNKIDSESIDRISYYSGFTGHSVTITLTQNGSTAIYSGDTNSFKFWSQGGVEGFVFGTNIGIPPAGTPSGTATLIQAAPTPWVIGDPVYVSLEIT